MEASVNKCGNCNYPHGVYSFTDQGELFICPRCAYQSIKAPAVIKKNSGYFVMVTEDRGTQTGIYNDVSFIAELDRNSNDNPHILSVGYSMKNENGKFYWVTKNNSTKEVMEIEWTADLFLVNGKLVPAQKNEKNNE